MNNLTDSDESMLDEIFGVDEDSGGIDLPAFAPARLQDCLLYTSPSPRD